ncbi:MULTISPECIES: RES family NAD+ phosphorylase [Pseudomonadaceae]|uniref:RES family NAD+ phosphorylase n=1 Tax=Pseudomonas solani TaxID=2731552 RepID=UPI0005BCF885
MTKFVCIQCILDPYLRNRVDHSKTEECSYCEKVAFGLMLEELADYCEHTIFSSFVLVAQPSAVIHHGYPPHGMSVTDTLRLLLANSDTDLLEDIESELRCRWAEWDDDDPYFEEGSDTSLQMTTDWRSMQESLLYESRLVNASVAKVLERVFGDIEQLQTDLAGRSTIVVAGPQHPISAFHRARSFDNETGLSDALMHPELSLGPTPKGIASAGRMNAKGISVFYGSTDERTAIAEVRPPVGSFVATAVFELTRPIRLLNLADFSSVRPNAAWSYFDPARQDQAERCAFLQQLKDRMLIPVMPNAADQDYLITQAIADFLATHPRLNLDGILFPSVQAPEDSAPGQNVVLFHKASGVERTRKEDALEHVELWEPDEDQWRFAPEIFEAKPQLQSALISQNQRSGRVSTLRLDRSRIAIHKIKAVSFAYNTDPVRHVLPGEIYRMNGRR